MAEGDTSQQADKWNPSLQASQDLGSNVAAANETTGHVLARSGRSHRLARREGLVLTEPRT